MADSTDETHDPKGGGKWGARIAYFTPLHSMRRAGAAMAGARNRVAETIQGFKSALPARDPNTPYADDDVRSISDASQRFNAMYEMHGWSQAELNNQKRACSRTKLACLSVAVIALVLTFGALFFAPLWILFFALPIGGSAVILGVAQAFKFALYETQIDAKSLIDAKEFYARDDFFARLIG